MISRKALITGISGQDGAYLSQLLLEKGYKVYGAARRTASGDMWRLRELGIENDVEIVTMELAEQSNIDRLIRTVRPDELYNLAAMSFVGSSFDIPVSTGDSNGLGVTRLLESIRNFSPLTKFYQASTSEMFGKVKEVPQNEKTPFHPRSPYGVAKLYAHWMTTNYRESYDMFCCSGILFNHETVAGFMPMIYKIGKDGPIGIKPISEIVKNETLNNGCLVDESKKDYQEGLVEKDLYVWDNSDWTKVQYASGYPHKKDLDNKFPKYINARNACYMATSDHVIINEDGSETEIKNLTCGDKVKLVDFPISNSETGVSLEEAELLGLIVGDGSYSSGKRVRFINSDINLRNHVADLWNKISKEQVKYYPSKSGFSDKIVGYIDLVNSQKWIKNFSIYNLDKTKRIPFQILNSSKEIKEKFLVGYNSADGLKRGYKTNYLFKNFKTNSATLASGLVFLVSEVTGQDYNINIDVSDKWGKTSYYYSINLNSCSLSGQNSRNSFKKYEIVKNMLNENLSQRQIYRDTGISRTFIRKVSRGYVPSNKHHLLKNKNEIKKIINCSNYDGWFYDLTTESGKFHCGIGQGRVHNSPLRGHEFVTKKITRNVAKILNGKEYYLELGNMDAKRDWGHASDYVRGMYMMMQHDTPDDYVLATGKMHTVQEFVDAAFGAAGHKIRWVGEGLEKKGLIGSDIVVVVNPKFYRPCEVDELCGNAYKARAILGWKPEISFEDLVAEMVESDLKEKV